LVASCETIQKDFSDLVWILPLFFFSPVYHLSFLDRPLIRDNSELLLIVYLPPAFSIGFIPLP